MSLYLDTSALAKLIISEAESGALRSWLGERRGQPLMTNALGAVELQRLAARVSAEAREAAVLLLARIDLLSLTQTVLSAASQLPPPEVRTLDAVHVASAAEISDLQALVTYDSRMRATAHGYGLPVAAPGT